MLLCQATARAGWRRPARAGRLASSSLPLVLAAPSSPVAASGACSAASTGRLRVLAAAASTRRGPAMPPALAPAAAARHFRAIERPRRRTGRWLLVQRASKPGVGNATSKGAAQSRSGGGGAEKSGQTAIRKLAAGPSQRLSQQQRRWPPFDQPSHCRRSLETLVPSPSCRQAPAHAANRLLATEKVTALQVPAGRRAVGSSRQSQAAASTGRKQSRERHSGVCGSNAAIRSPPPPHGPPG